MITIPDHLSHIAYTIELFIDSIIFSILFKKFKTQSILIDPEKYKFSYSYKKMRVLRWRLYVMIASHGAKRFITTTKFKEAKHYNVIFLEFDL